MDAGSQDVDAIGIDCRGDGTSETMAMVPHLDGRVSLVTGTHSRDDSVIGMKKDAAAV